MKAIDDESEDTGKGLSADAGAVKKSEHEQRETGVQAGSPVYKGRATECRSITLYGDGDHSGRDINNAMSLAEAYGKVVLMRLSGESGAADGLVEGHSLLANIPIGGKGKGLP